jgi:hypothetical protein
MRPPAEQLIRDYLNRLSVAARTRLQSDDRRAFLARTRDFIETRSGAVDTADPAAVMRILSELGEPEAAVERESARLAALRSQRAAAAARSGLWKSRARDSRPSEEGRPRGQPANENSATPAPAPSPPKIAGRELTGEIAITSRPISARWKPGAPLKPRPARPLRVPKPRRGRSPVPERNGTAEPGPEADRSGAKGRLPGPAAGAPPARAGSAGSGPAAGAPPGPAGSAGSGPAAGAPPPRAGSAGSGPRPAASRGVAVSPAPSGGAVKKVAPSAPAPSQESAPANAGPANGVPAPARMTTARQRRLQLIQPTDVTRGIAAGVADAWRQNPLAVVAVALLALGGLIFPLVIWLLGLLIWLAGVAIAIPLRQWSPVDKLLSFAGPPVLVIVGTAIAVSIGGARQNAAAYGHEALADAADLFKAGTLLGALYLAWRIQRGRRGPVEPSWARRRS